MPDNNLKNKIISYFTVLLLLVGGCAGDNALTPEDKKDSKEQENPEAPKNKEEANKETVVQKIEKLFSSRGGYQQKVQSTYIPAYTKIIPGKDEKTTIFYKCRFVKSKTIIDALESIISSSGSVEESADQNIIVINDVKSKTEELQAALLAIDVPQPQVLVQADIIEVYLENGVDRDVKLEYTQYDASKQLTDTWGYNMDAPTQNKLADQGAGFDFFPYAAGDAGEDNKRLNATVNWLKTSRDAKILSSPIMIVNQGTTASMITGEDVPIQSTSVTSGTVTTSTTYKRIGVKLNVTPSLINKDTVQIEINPEVSSISRYETFTQNSVTVSNPVVAVRNIKTSLTLSDGEIIMLGGLYSNEDTEALRKTPGFSDVPYVGDLFTAKEKKTLSKQLIFFLKISIVKETTGYLYDVEDNASKINAVSEAVKASKKIFPERREHKQQSLLDDWEMDSPKDSSPAQ